MAKERIITISKMEGDEKGTEKVRTYQKDGVTVQVAVGVPQRLPEDLFWVADLAKEIGDINDFIEIDK